MGTHREFVLDDLLIAIHEGYFNLNKKWQAGENDITIQSVRAYHIPPIQVKNSGSVSDVLNSVLRDSESITRKGCKLFLQVLLTLSPCLIVYISYTWLRDHSGCDVTA